MLKRRHAPRLVLGGLLALVLLYFFFRGVDAGRLAGALASAHPGWLFGIVVSTALTYALRAWRWGALLAPLAPVPFERLLRVTVVAFMTGLVIPRASEVVRPLLVTRSHGIKATAGFATVVLERLVDLITVLALFFVYLYLLPLPAEQAPEPLPLLKAAGLGAAAIAGVALSVLAAFHYQAERALGAIDWMLAWLPARVGPALGQMARSFSHGLLVLQAPLQRWLVIGAQSLLLWLAIALGIHSAGHAFGLALPFRATFLILAFLTVGVSIPTPGMVGGFHEAYLIALTAGFGADRNLAAAAGITLHAVTNLPILIVGLAWLSREGLTLDKVQELTEEERP